MNPGSSWVQILGSDRPNPGWTGEDFLPPNLPTASRNSSRGQRTRTQIQNQRRLLTSTTVQCRTRFDSSIKLSSHASENSTGFYVSGSELHWISMRNTSFDRSTTWQSCFHHRDHFLSRIQNCGPTAARAAVWPQF